MVEFSGQSSSLNISDLKNNSAALSSNQYSSPVDFRSHQNIVSTNCLSGVCKSSHNHNCETVNFYQSATLQTHFKKNQNRYSWRKQRLKQNSSVEKLPNINNAIISDRPLEHHSSEENCNGGFVDFPNESVLKFSSINCTNKQQLLQHSNSCPELYCDISKKRQRRHSFSRVDSRNVPHLSNVLDKLHRTHMPPQHSKQDKNATLNHDKPDLPVEQLLSTNDNQEEKLENNMTKPTDTGWKTQHSRSKSDGTGVLDARTFSNDVPVSVDGILSASLPSVLPEQEEQKKKSIFEGGGVIVSTECFFPRPQPGQTLTSFLSSGFNICAELDRENAHFCISEALISAIEQIKCTEKMRFVAEEAESDEEIKKLTQRIRIRRRERLQEKVARNAVLLNDVKTDTTTTTSQSVSPMSTSHSSDFDAADSIGSEEEIADLDLSDHDASNLKSMKESGLSLSLASMYSDADIHKGPFAQPNIDPVEKRLDIDSSGVHLSAEAVALSLLKRFSEKQLPKASDLEWLVSEQDAPQRLLPLPDSWPVAPDAIDEEFDLEKTRLRGNLEWAPPRQQIIFFIHPVPKRKDAILKQNYRCAGCGMKIERCYIKKFRYCEYLGKFFCQCCHANDLAYIPGRILWKWNFRQYYVSKFSWKLLDQMFCDPLFNVMDINSKLYRKIKQLDLCRDYRLQLFYLKDFIRTCRNSEQIQKEFDQLPEYIYYEPHLYSISDFLKVKSGELSRLLSNLTSRCTTHVMRCILCQAKGFICEMCNNSSDIIFPFQLNKVCHCIVCGSCYHKLCFKPGICPKCVRIQERKKKLQEQKELLYSDEEL